MSYTPNQYIYSYVKVQWSIVYKGILLQVIMALCTVRWAAGRVFFQHVGDKIETFLSYSYVGAAFVYSDNLVYKQAIFAFQVNLIIGFIIETKHKKYMDRRLVLHETINILMFSLSLSVNLQEFRLHL